MKERLIYLAEDHNWYSLPEYRSKVPWGDKYPLPNGHKITPAVGDRIVVIIPNGSEIEKSIKKLGLSVIIGSWFYTVTSG